MCELDTEWVGKSFYLICSLRGFFDLWVKCDTRVVIPGYGWLYMVVFGYIWVCLVILGYWWLYLVMDGYTRLWVVILGYAWLYLVMLGYTIKCTPLHELSTQGGGYFMWTKAE